MKLNLGCFNKKMYGYVNIDARSEVKPDVVDDVFTLVAMPNNSVDVIYCCHVLEHAHREEALQAMMRWYDIMKIGGILRIAVPDLEAVFEYYRETKNLSEIMAFLYGSQKHKYDTHYTGWDFKTLKADLENTGFRRVQRYDWRTTEHFYVDDYSQCYLPKISYKTRRPEGTIEGKLVSLNVEAIKV